MKNKRQNNNTNATEVRFHKPNVVTSFVTIDSSASNMASSCDFTFMSAASEAKRLVPIVTETSVNLSSLTNEINRLFGDDSFDIIFDQRPYKDCRNMRLRLLRCNKALGKLIEELRNFNYGSEQE